MGIADTMASNMQDIFNYWTRVSISDKNVKKLIQHALAPRNEVLKNLKEGKEEELSACFTNMVDSAFEYAMSHPTQQMETTRGTVFGAYNAVTGYFQNVRNYRDDQAKLTSILMGGTAQLRGQTAFNLCVDYTNKGLSSLELRN